MKFVELDEKLFLGKGGERSSYIHPDDDTKIIKVIHLQGKHNNQNELEYTYMRYLEKKCADFSHIIKCYGWVDTNKGQGLIFERVENFDKTPMRTLSYYSKFNLLDEQTGLKLIQDLKNYLFKNSILFIDASLSNVFCQKIAEDQYKLIIFDGLGARRTGIKFWFYLKSSLFTKYKMKKQWKIFLNNYHYERSLKLKREE